MGRDKQRAAEYAAWYRTTESGKAARKRAQEKFYGSDKWRESHRRGIAAYRARNRERRLAHQAVDDAVSRGKIRRPSWCDLCGRIGPVQGHHYNGYAKPHRLDVLWLCMGCHRDIHPLGAPKKPRPVSGDSLDTESGDGSLALVS